MSARGTVGGVVASAAIIVIAWQVGQSTATAGEALPSASHPGSTASSATPTTPATAPSSAASPSASASAPASAPAAAAPPPKAAASGKFTGDTVQTPFGNMQVALVVSGGKVTDVTVLQRTDQGQRSVQISDYADPRLRTEVLQAQSANVQMISGATYTSEGYLQSVQSALDKAGI